MADYIQVNDPVSPSLVDGVIVPDKDGVFAISSTAKHESNGHGSPSMKLQITINGNIDYDSKPIGWQDGAAQQQGVTTEAMKAGQEYKIEARSFNSNAKAAGISMSVNRL